MLAVLAGSALGFGLAPATVRMMAPARMSTVNMAGFYDFSAAKIDGSAAPMSAYKGKPTLILNVASL